MAGIYEDVLEQWGRDAEIPIKIGNRENCRIEFPDENVTIQIDLAPSGEAFLFGCMLGQINPGPYRDLVFKTALKANGFTSSPRGILSYSDTLSALFLHEYFPLATTDAEKLGNMIVLFRTHAKVWTDALKAEIVPDIEDAGESSSGSGMFGMGK